MTCAFDARVVVAEESFDAASEFADHDVGGSIGVHACERRPRRREKSGVDGLEVLLGLRSGGLELLQFVGADRVLGFGVFVVLVAGQLGGLDLGVEAGGFGGEFAALVERVAGEESDGGLVGEVGGVLVVLGRFGGGEPAFEDGLPSSAGGGLEVEDAVFPPGRCHTCGGEAVDAFRLQVRDEGVDEVGAKPDECSGLGKSEQRRVCGLVPPLVEPGSGALLGDGMSDRVTGSFSAVRVSGCRGSSRRNRRRGR